MTWTAVLELVVAASGAAALFTLALRRPAVGAAVAALLVPLTAGIPRGTSIPLARPDELVILAVGGGLIARQVVSRYARPIGLLDFAVGAFAVGGLAIPLLVLTITQYPATASTWWAVIAPVWFLLAYYSLAGVQPSPEGIRTILNGVMLAGVIVAAVAVAEAAGLPGVRGIVQDRFPAAALSDFRPGSTLGGFEAVGAFGVVTFALALAIAAGRVPGFPRLWLALVMCAGAGGVLAAQSWPALLALPVVTVAVVAYTRRVPAELIAAGAVLVVGLVLVGPQLAAYFDGQRVVIVQGLALPESPASRLRYWEQYVVPALAGQMWFGTGTVIPGSVPNALAALADNEYLGAAFRAGIVGAVLVVAMEVSIGALAFRLRRSDDPAYRALGAVALAVATTLLWLGVTGENLAAGGLAEEVALLAGVTAIALEAGSRRLASQATSASRWPALAGTGPARVRLAPAGVSASGFGFASAVRRSDEAPAPASGIRPLSPGSARTPQPPSTVATPPRPRRLPAPYRVAAILMIALLGLVLVRISPMLVPSDDQLVLKLGGQAVAPLDLRQAAPISPYLFGANVFPASGTVSSDAATGFMSYDAATVTGLRSGDIGLLRFPGGAWGEKHLLSLDQLSAYAGLLNATGAQGMIQARLSGEGNGPGFRSVSEKANVAGAWVDFMDNKNSRLRTGANANAPFHPVLLWSVGNEPDLSVDDSGQPYTVAEYTNAFIQFSILMHQNNPTIKVFGPELSHFDGIDAGPRDANGQLWMEAFISGVAAYEKAHPELTYHLLDGVSFHFYPGTNPQQASTDLMANAERWNYVLDPLRQFIRQTLGRDAPLAVTEINSYATDAGPPSQLSALWWADTLGTLMNQELQYLAFFAAEGVDSPYPLMSSADQSPTSMLRVLQLFSHLQRNLIPLSSAHEPISVYATQNDTSQTVSMLLINKSAAEQLAQIGGAQRILGVSAWPSLDVSLAPYSATVLTLQRGGGADAFTLDSQGASAAGAPALTHTVCGHKSDALALQTPC